MSFKSHICQKEFHDLSVDRIVIGNQHHFIAPCWSLLRAQSKFLRKFSSSCGTAWLLSHDFDERVHQLRLLDGTSKQRSKSGIIGFAGAAQIVQVIDENESHL